MKYLLVLCLFLAAGCKPKSRFGSGQDKIERGERGETGAKGDKGDTGEAGLQGIPGIQGRIGLQGPIGRKGKTGARGLTGPVGAKGMTGADGKDGIDVIKPQVYLIPTYGKCVKLMSGVYVKNEGRVADFYNNSRCSHGTNDNGVYCNDVVDGERGGSDREICTVIFSNQKMYRFTVVGQDDDMCIVEETFLDLPAYKLLD